MEANKQLEKQAETISIRLMNDVKFNNMVATTARTKHDGTFAINSDKEYNDIQLLLADAYTALVAYSVQGKPLNEENVEIILQCLTELKRLSDNEWLRMSGCFSRKPVAN